MKPQLLTKSRFVMGVECPQKLVYASDPRYRNLKQEDSFLASLADGGFQVGEFAKAHFPGGHDVETLNKDAALQQTQDLLAAGDCVIFEAAVKHQNCFIRVDVLEKRADRLIIHEVKAKSFDSREEKPFLNKKGTQPTAKWSRYLYDVAFQKHVVSAAFPDANVTANLMLMDKASVCPVDGLQCFKILDEGGRRSAKQVTPIPQAVLDARLLRSVPVDLECDVIFGLTQHGDHHTGSFSELVEVLSEVCAGIRQPGYRFRKGCGDCEFKSLSAGDDKRSGFSECLAALAGIQACPPGGLLFDLWDNRGKDKQLDSGAIRLTDITEEDLKSPSSREPGAGLTRTQRQWLQIEKYRDSDATPYVDREGLQAEADGWQFPLHFIDFETTRTALPFFEGHRPYHNIAFQFSHHTLSAEGHLVHAHQFLLADADTNPNVAFVRALQDAVGADDGTIFMYSNHENTTLGAIRDDLLTAAVPDREELCAFIESITHPGKDSASRWQPARPMVDLHKVVKDYVYLPETHGSNSLKAVLPAILNASADLQSRYSSPIYGKECEIPSLNLDATVWIERDGAGHVINPYLSLPDLAADLTTDQQAELTGIEQIKDGGAALTAYARLMYEDLQPATRAAIERALLQYCELDTLAMVFLYQGLKSLLDVGSKQ